MRFYLVTAAVLLNECKSSREVSEEYTTNAGDVEGFCTDFASVDQENAIFNNEAKSCCIRDEGIEIQFERDVTGGANNFFAA